MNTPQDEEMDEGGFAFPVRTSEHGYHTGMSLRDWFAGMALQGLLAAPHTAAIMVGFHKEGKNATEQVVGMSCEIADAMLAARKERP